MTYRIVHRTRYRYESEVTASYGQAHLLPREAPGQTCRTSRVTVEPRPNGMRERTDFFGNRALWYSILEPHEQLVVTTTSEVDVSGRQATLPLSADQPWERARDRLRDEPGDEELAARPFVLDSPLAPASPALLAFAEPSFPAGRPVLEALLDLTSRIHAGFEYVPGSTTVSTPLAEVLELRKGVCQDFAQLAIGCLRAMGLAARYVSGYLETDPPPGQERLQGADVSHAWASLFVPDAGWVDVDPTNDVLVGDRHITTAWGRDYGDVPPLKGVIFTDGTKHELEVEVDVTTV